MATFVHASGGAADEQGVVNPALDLARHIYTLTGQDPSTVDEQITDQKGLDIALNNLDKIFAQVESKDALEGVMNVVCWLFQRVLQNAAHGAVVDQFVAKLTADSSVHPALRLKTLSTVYNVVRGNGSARYNIFLAIVKYASAAGPDHLALVKSQCSQLSTMLAEWGVDVKKSRDLYTTVFEAMEKHGDKELAHLYRKSFLATFQGDKDLSGAKKQASVAVVEAIANPTVYQFDEYLEIDAVIALQGDGEYGKLYELLNIFASQDLDTYNKYCSANGASVDKLGLNKDACVLKMRLLSLCTLGASKREIQYSEIASCMQVNEADVEQWMIKAMTVKLLDAKMDQLNKKVLINHCTDRMFGKKQWQELRDKMSLWRDNMRELMQMIDVQKQHMHSQMQAQQHMMMQ